MMGIHHRDWAGSAEKVLIVAADPGDAIEHRREICARNAGITCVCDVAEAAEAARTERYDAILVFARADASATALMLRLMKAEAAGAPRLLFLVDAAASPAYAAAMAAADETMAMSLSTRRVCDAAGIGLATGFPQRAAFG
ncbi:MAG: hypothetical protein ACRCTI_05815 [Beijerinckiaceae bacterium]